MPLDLNRLEKVRHMPGGRIEARCPACAAGGGDSKGTHLRIAVNGSFCCVVNPGAGGKWHRKEIFSLAGYRDNREKRLAPIVWRLKRR